MIYIIKNCNRKDFLKKRCNMGWLEKKDLPMDTINIDLYISRTDQNQ